MILLTSRVVMITRRVDATFQSPLTYYDTTWADSGAAWVELTNNSKEVVFTSRFQCQVELQNRIGGNANIGRELYPLLNAVGFKYVMVSPRLVYVDSSKPGLVEGFTKNTFTAMIEGVRESSIAAGLINGTTFDDGIKALYRTSEQDGVFCYTFFKAIGTKRKST